MNVDNRTHESVRKGSRAGKPDPKVIIKALRNILIIPEHREKLEPDVRWEAVFSLSKPAAVSDRTGSGLRGGHSACLRRADCHPTNQTPARIRTMPAISRIPMASPKITADNSNADTGMRLTNTPAREGPTPLTPYNQACCPKAVANTMRYNRASQPETGTTPTPVTSSFRSVQSSGICRRSEISKVVQLTVSGDR